MDEKQGLAVSGKQELIYQRTGSATSLKEEGISVRDALNIFWGMPIEEIRDSCVEHVVEQMDRYRRRLSEEEISWFEEHIPIILRSEEIDTRYTYGERLLSGYLFFTSPETRIRALEFALSLALGTARTAQGMGGYPYCSGPLFRKLSKIIPSVIRKYPELYWASSVPEFLEASLANDNWTTVERALELICRAEDTSFLPRVIELSRKAGEEKEKKEDFKTKASEERFASAKSRGVLSEAVRHLLICQTEQNEDAEKFKHEIARTLYSSWKLSQHPLVWLIFSKGQSLEVKLEIESQKEPDYIGSVLEKDCNLWLMAEGAEISTLKGVEPMLHRRDHRVPFITSSNYGRYAVAKILPSRRKTVRLTFMFGIRDRSSGAWRDSGAKLVRYVTLR